MKGLHARLAALAVALLAAGATPSAGANASAHAWSTNVAFTNVVATSPTSGGGYPVPPGSRVPLAGTCRAGPFDANHSESWLAVKPGTEDLVGSSKFFFDKYSTFYMFYLGATQILDGTPAGSNQIQGYDCVSTGTQAMPPSWTDTTDPNVDFDTKGRVYQTMLPFNSFFDATRLHPDGEIDISYSDDLGRHWVKGNGGVALEPPNNASALQLGSVRGLTEKTDHARRGRARLNAANSTRSASLSCGRCTCRRKIESSCRSTRISSSFDLGDRHRSTTSSNRRQTTK